MKRAILLVVIIGLNASHASAEIVAAKVASSADQFWSALTGSGLASAVQAPLIVQFRNILKDAKCTATANSVDCSQASQDQLATAQDALQELRGDFTAALRQATATQALAKTFVAGAVQVRSAIATEGLTAAAQAPLIAQYLKILSAAKCTSTASGVDCSQASQDQLTTAQDALQQLRYGLTAALKQAAAGPSTPQTLAANAGQLQNTIAQTFAAGAGQVRSAIVDPKLTAAAQQQLIGQFAAILNAANCTIAGNVVDCAKSSQAQLATAQSALQTLRTALTAALAQAAATQALAQTVAAGAGTLRTAIADSGLAAATQAKLIGQFAQILNAAKCTITAKNVDCSQSSSAQLTTAQSGLQTARTGLIASIQQAAAALALDQNTFAVNANKVRSKLEAEKIVDKLLADAQAYYLGQLQKIVDAAKCASTAKGVANCSQSTLPLLATAQSSLNALSAQIAQPVRPTP